MKYINLFFAALTTVFIGLFTVVLLPALFVYWLLYWRPMEWRELSRAANPHSPTDAVRCDGGEPEQAFDLPIDAPATLESYPLPDVFAEWINKKGLR
jgi:hypothetical protein